MTEKYNMRPVLRMISAALAVACLAAAESAAPLTLTRISPVQACRTAVPHGVWLTQESYAPVFGDEGLVTYLARVAREAGGGVPVLPLYTPQLIHLRRAGVVFLSTGFILAAHDEQELAEAIRSEARGMRAGESACLPAMCPRTEYASLTEAQDRLAAQIREYQELITPRLRRR